MERHRAEHNADHACDVRLNLALGRACTSRDYVQAQRVRAQMLAQHPVPCEMHSGIRTSASARRRRSR